MTGFENALHFATSCLLKANGLNEHTQQQPLDFHFTHL